MPLCPVKIAGLIYRGFFGLFKNGVRGSYHSVSHKWLQGYVNEYVWRYNRRDDEQPMFDQLLDRAAQHLH